MNILFFLTPKINVEFVYDDDTLRQALEKISRHRYTCIPIINKDGLYVGSMTEGDLLWAIKDIATLNIKDAENIYVKDIKKIRSYKPITVNTQMEDILTLAMDQNFIPVVDDTGSFIGIITRKVLIQYLMDKLKTK